MFPATGSTSTAAISSPRAANSASTAARSLNGATSVSATVAGVTPGESGSPSVATPEPAAASSGVRMAVVAPVELDDGRGGRWPPAPAGPRSWSPRCRS